MLDIEQHDQLLAYLRDSGRIGRDESPEMRTLAGGVSNRTVWVKRASGEAWVLKQALAKLRVKVDWFSDPARVHREALGLRWLEKLAPPGTITPLVFEDQEHHLLAMQAVPEPHENWKTMLLDERLDVAHVSQFGSILGTIHQRASDERETLAHVFDDRTFFESLRVEPYYAYTGQCVPAARDFLDRLITDVRASRWTLVHGDYSPKNILVHDGRLVVLDHEVIHWGDGSFDLGFALAHLLSKAHHLTLSSGRFLTASVFFMADYWGARGMPVPDAALEAAAVRHALACLLARVAGRSPLEYLDDHERDRQTRVVVKLMSDPPKTVSTLSCKFVYACKGTHGDD